MGNFSKKRKHGTLTKKQVLKSLKLIPRLLVFIGKPSYLILSYTILFLLSIAYITGYLFRRIISLTLPIALIPLKTPQFPKRKIAKTGFTLSFFFSSLIALTFWQFVLKDLPSPQELTTRNIEVTTKIYDRNGLLLYKIYKDKNRTPVSLAKIPKHVQLATLAIEDAEFYSHPGFSIKGIIRSAIKNLEEGKLTGGSTITQQLVKNALLSSEKTLIRKLKEVTLAFQVELNFSKDEILEMYLNEVSYGGTAYGIQEAAKTYFAKDVEKLTLGEAALLAGLPKSPTNFSPFGTNPRGSIARQKEVLNLMEINGFISEDQSESAQSADIKFTENKIDIKAPHFVMYIRENLENEYGKEVVEQGGLEVTTTLDLHIQNLAEQVVKEEVEKLKNLNVTNGAALVLNPKTGEVLAMVGSKNYYDTEAEGNVNVTLRPRQPGSSIKIINYSYALSNKMNAASIIEDSPITFLVDGQPPYTPRNYEGKFRGKLTLRSALAESRNIPAVKVLASYGFEKMIEQGRKMGITTWNNPSDYGLSLTLGGGEVKLIDLAQAYATIANYGKRPEIASILKVVDYKGKVLEENECEEEKVAPRKAQKQRGKQVEQVVQVVKVAKANKKTQPFNYLTIQPFNNCPQSQVIDSRVAFIITDILRDNKARSPAFGINSLLNIAGHPEVAVKTGTSNNLRDNLAIGYNQNYLVAVWVGNNDNSEMARIASGVTGATPIFNKIMSALLAEKPNLPAGRQVDDWKVPEGLVQLPICPYTATLACTGCPVKMEWFLEENKPEKACSPEWFKKKEEEDKVDEVE